MPKNSTQKLFIPPLKAIVIPPSLPAIGIWLLKFRKISKKLGTPPFYQPPTLLSHPES